MTASESYKIVIILHSTDREDTYIGSNNTNSIGNGYREESNGVDFNIVILIVNEDNKSGSFIFYSKMWIYPLSFNVVIAKSYDTDASYKVEESNYYLVEVSYYDN